MQAGPPSRSAGRPLRPVGGLDLRRFASRPDLVEPRWRHAIRPLERGARVALPELAGFGDPSAVAARLTVDRWELKVRARRNPGRSGVTCDARGRVLVPLGVRRALDLRDAVVVSLSADSSTVVIWPTATLDRLLEVPA